MEECANDADGDDCDARRHVRGNHVARASVRSGAAVTGGSRIRDRRLPDRERGLRRNQRRLLLHPVCDRCHPGPCREHRLLGLSAPCLLHGARQVHAEPVHVPGRSPRLHHRHRDAGRSFGNGPGSVRRRDGAPDSSVCGRRLRRLHPLTVGNGGALAEAKGTGLETGPHRQCDRRNDDGHRRGRRRLYPLP